MSKKHIEFLGRDFGIFYYNDNKANLYNGIKDKIEANNKSGSSTSRGTLLFRKKSKSNETTNKATGVGLYGPFWKYLENGISVFDDEMREEDYKKITIKQDDHTSDYSLVVVGKAFDTILLHTSKGIIKHTFDISTVRDYSVAWFDIDLAKGIEKMVIQFKHNILEPMEINVKLITYQEIEQEKAEKQKELDAIVPDIKHKFSLGESLVNIKFDLVYEDKPIFTKIELYDNQKDIMGTFAPAEGMRYLSIKDLAYGKYFYIIKQFDENNQEIQKTNFTEFVLKQPNYSGKPMR